MSGQGAPIGNQNAAKSKRWTWAIEKCLTNYPKRPDTTDCSDVVVGILNAAYMFVEDLYTQRDIAFYREVGDRLEGKPHQSMDVDLKAEVRDASSLTDDELARRALSAGDTATP